MFSAPPPDRFQRQWGVGQSARGTSDPTTRVSGSFIECCESASVRRLRAGRRGPRWTGPPSAGVFGKVHTTPFAHGHKVRGNDVYSNRTGKTEKGEYIFATPSPNFLQDVPPRSSAENRAAVPAVTRPRIPSPGNGLIFLIGAFHTELPWSSVPPPPGNDLHSP